MRIHRYILILCAIVCTITITSQAQVKEGLTELNLSGAYSAIESDSISTYSILLSASGGYFIFPFLEVGGDFSLTKMKKEDLIGALGPFVSFHLPFTEDATIVPFAGIQGGTTFGWEENQYYYGGFLGTKAFIGNGGGGAVSLQLFYLRWDPSKKSAVYNNFGVLTGISIFF